MLILEEKSGVKIEREIDLRAAPFFKGAEEKKAGSSSHSVPQVRPH